MPIHGEYQFGIDDGKLAAINTAGELSTTKVDILGISAFSVSTESDQVDHRGDNQIVRSRKTGKQINGSTEQAATDLAAMAIVADGTTASSGTTPAVITTYTEPVAIGAKTYQMEVQAADINGATRFTILRASTTGGPNFELSEGEFSNPGWDWTGQGMGGNLFTIKQYETEVAIE